MEFFIDNNKNLYNNSTKNNNNHRYFFENNNDGTSSYNSDIYIRNYISIINELSSSIANFYFILKKSINDMRNISITLGNQTIYSKSLLLEMSKNDDKYFQLSDRIEMINDTKKLLDNNLSITNDNINIFILETKKNFKKLKHLRIQQKHNLRRNNQNLNFNSVSRDKINKNYSLFSNSNESNYEDNNYLNMNNILNNYRIYSKKNYTNDNFKKNINNYLKQSRKEFRSFDNFLEENEYENKNFSPNNKYKKVHLNKSQEIISPNHNKQINSRNYATLINNRITRNKNRIKTSNHKNNSCLAFKSYNILNNNKNELYNEKKTNTNLKDYRDKMILYNQDKNNKINNIELQLAYKIIEFITLLNNVQSNKINLENKKEKYESLKNNIVYLTNKVIKENNYNYGENNKNIINNNFIYNNNDIIDRNKNNINIGNDRLIKQINQLKIKNKDLELFIKLKENEYQKVLNKLKNLELIQ